MPLELAVLCGAPRINPAGIPYTSELSNLKTLRTVPDTTASFHLDDEALFQEFLQRVPFLLDIH